MNKKILDIIKEELSAVKAKFGDARRTQITDDSSDVDIADLIAEEDVVITLTHNNYIKRIPVTTYRNQKTRWSWRYWHGYKRRRLC